MPLETGDWIEDLDPSNPTPNDPKSQGDDHIRLIKKVVQDQFPNLGAAPVTSTAAQLSAVGQVAGFAHSVAIDGWQVCDGSELDRTAFAGLFEMIGVTYGEGDGSTTFNLPDYRGQFLRGLDLGAGIDPDAATRTNRGDGTDGDAVGTKQGQQNNSHTHNTIANHTHGVQYYNDGGSQAGRIVASSGNPTQGTVQTLGAGGHTHTADGGAEARPVNVYIEYRISV